MGWRLARVAVSACLLAAASATMVGVPGAVAAPLPAGTWGAAKPVVLPPVVNFGQFATVNSIACPTAGLTWTLGVLPVCGQLRGRGLPSRRM
jgi:hypothetical protein